MRFTVPQFIEYEARIIGPLTFRQFVFFAIAGAFCFALYFAVGKTNFPLFLLLSAFLFGGAASLAFLQTGGKSLPAIMGSFFRFILSPKIYIWKRKEMTFFFKKERAIKKDLEKEEELPLKIAEGSQLKKIRTRIETKTK